MDAAPTGSGARCSFVLVHCDVMHDRFLLHTAEGWHAFLDCRFVVTTSDPGEVRRALRAVEHAVERHGWYAVGFLSYEAAPAFDSAFETHPPTDLPLLWFALCARREARSAGAVFPWPDALPGITWALDIEQTDYADAITDIRAQIAGGATYQVNYTARYDSVLDTAPIALFHRLARHQHRHAAFLDLPEWSISSGSHELFFALEGDEVTCRPMKGTGPRGADKQNDADLAAALQSSPKDRAENLMIVDMVRNDLGRVARSGSVLVPALFEVEPYPTLYQMTSTVTCRTDASLTELFTALFPAASITGAPKVSAMQHIRRLETSPRGLYTGTIGWIGPGRKAAFNVAIRTAVVHKPSGAARYGVGGGITWDSRPETEYAEATLKARVLTEPDARTFHLFETLRWDPGQGWFLLDRHIHRLLHSARYFGFPTATDELFREAFCTCAGELVAQADGPRRVRIQLDANGRLHGQTVPITPTASPFRARLASRPVLASHPFLRHKTSVRQMYEDPRPHGVEEILHYNEHGELTEFGIGNLVLDIDGERVTPPVSAGLLPGTFRAELLAQGLLTERTLTRAHLARAQGIFLINAVRRWVPITLVDGA
jgi:para-aminobenzoate synthetase / 4-amino-4-deoxychorismate lyase